MDKVVLERVYEAFQEYKLTLRRPLAATNPGN